MDRGGVTWGLVSDWQLLDSRAEALLQAKDEEVGGGVTWGLMCDWQLAIALCPCLFLWM